MQWQNSGDNMRTVKENENAVIARGLATKIFEDYPIDCSDENDLVETIKNYLDNRKEV